MPVAIDIGISTICQVEKEKKKQTETINCHLQQNKIKSKFLFEMTRN